MEQNGANQAASGAARMQVSIVIPAYNEEKRLPDTLIDLAARIRQNELQPLQVAEILIVDDGSTDATARVVADLSNAIPGLKLVPAPNGENHGKGYAMRHGLATAASPWALITDADMATPWTEARHLARKCFEGSHDVAIGSRDLPESELVRHQSWLRESLGKTFNCFVRLISGLPFKDTQCGFKLVRLDKASGFLDELRVNRFAWDVEFLIAARDNGASIIEVPVRWEHKHGSKISVFKDGFEMVKSVISVRLKRRFTLRWTKQLRG